MQKAQNKGRNNILRILLLMVLIELLFMIIVDTKPVTSQTGGIVWTVDDDGPANFHTIQAAINAATEGDTIHVLPGNYHEHLTVNKPLSIEGELNYSSIITGDNTEDVVSVVADYVSLNHLVIENSGEFCTAIFLDSCKAAYLDGNLIRSNDNGITVSECLNTVISNNIARSNLWDGMTIRSSSQTLITNNTAAANINSGLTLLECERTTVHANTFNDNFYGIYLYQSNSTSVFDNTIVGNQQQARIISTQTNNTNKWDQDYPNGGNYWGDYNGMDLNQDAIGDTPYAIDENNTDLRPLMGTFSSFNTSEGLPIEVVSNSTIDDFQCFESNHTIKMHVTNVSAAQDFGFCRIAIPHAFMNETYNVTIEGAQPYMANLSLHDDGTYRWIYFSYQHSTLEVVIIPEFPNLNVFFVLVTAVILAFAYRTRKRLPTKFAEFENAGADRICASV